ncbi:MAG: hypothetical protein ABJA78_16975 [Ferruginibacter sp.]
MQETDSLMGEDLSLDGEPTEHLNEMTRWTKFIGIALIVCCVLALLCFVFASGSYTSIFGAFSIFRSLSSDMFVVVVIVLLIALAVVVLLSYHLINFSVKIKSGLETENPAALNKGLGSLKLYFIIMGIISILSALVNLFNVFKNS